MSKFHLSATCLYSMSFQVNLLAETSAANIAVVRPFAGVWWHVSAQVARCRVRFVANIALVRFYLKQKLYYCNWHWWRSEKPDTWSTQNLSVLLMYNVWSTKHLTTMLNNKHILAIVSYGYTILYFYVASTTKLIPVTNIIWEMSNV